MEAPLDPASLAGLWASSPIALGIVVLGFGLMALSAALAAGQWWRVRRAIARGEPPLITGWLPWVGAAITFGRAKPALFLRQCQDTYGSVWTLHVAGRYMTFLTDPAMFPTYFNTSEDVIDFQNATQPFLSRGFGVAKASYFAHHNAALECVRAKLLPKHLSTHYTAGLCNKFVHVFIEDWDDKGTGNLYEMIKQAIFWSSADLLFGISKENGLLDDPKDKSLLADFEHFDEDFELASSSIPHLFLSRFRHSKKRLLDFLATTSAFYKREEQKERKAGTSKSFLLGREILDSVGEGHGSNSWLLAILWAAEANTIPAIFWTITYLLSHPAELAHVRKEVDAKMKAKSGVLTYDDFASLQRVGNAVTETLRLKSAPIIVRATQQPLSVGNYTVPAGHFLCLSPLWSQRDERLYADPDAFKPDRWNDIDKDGRDRLNFIAFGAGKYRCPGKFFAYHEITVFVALVLYHYELELLEQVPEPNWMTLVGIQKPAASCQVFYKLRVPVIQQDE